MKIKLIWVGKTKEGFISEGISKYLRLLRPHTVIEVIEIKEEKGKDKHRIMTSESERILDLKLPYLLMDERGIGLDSIEFSELIRNQGAKFNFVVGGAYGVEDAVREKAVKCLSLSRMTFTHEISRLILLEQLYRSFTIINKKGYHH